MSTSTIISRFLFFAIFGGKVLADCPNGMFTEFNQMSGMIVFDEFEGGGNCEWTIAPRPSTTSSNDGGAIIPGIERVTIVYEEIEFTLVEMHVRRSKFDPTEVYDCVTDCDYLPPPLEVPGDTVYMQTKMQGSASRITSMTLRW